MCDSVDEADSNWNRLQPRHNLAGLSGADLGTERQVALVEQRISHYIIVLIGDGERRDKVGKEVVCDFGMIDAIIIISDELVVFGSGVLGAVDDLIVVIDVSFAYDHLAS